MIVFINGTYGVGKTQVANKINQLYNDKAKVLEPDQLWIEEIKKDFTVALGGGAYPQNNKKFLQILKNRIDKEIKECKGILIIPMTITEDLSYNNIIKPYKNNVKHFILTADEKVLRQRILEDKLMDKSLAVNNIENNKRYLAKISNAIFIDTSNMSIDEVAKSVIERI